MTIPYRTRRAARRLFSFALVLGICGAIVWFFWVLWLGRFVVYTAEGAKFDFSHSSADITGQVAAPPEAGEPISIYYNDGMDAVASELELAELHGYYIENADLKGDIDLLRRQISALPDNTPLMIELKDIWGNFYYASNLPHTPKADGVDIGAVSRLISDLAAGRRYLIATIPAFRDRAYGLENTNYGIASSEGAFLYMDNEGCYWLNPESNGTLGYLSQIVSELKGLGFDEVVFTDFSYPDSYEIDFYGDREESIGIAAEFCMKNFSTNNFAVSFATVDADFPMPEGRGRLYLSNISPNQLKRTIDSVEVPDKLINLVLMTTLNDNRYDEYSCLRSIQTTQ